MRLLISGITVAMTLYTNILTSGETMENDINACQETWNTIAARDYRQWNGLPPECGYSKLDGAFKRLRNEYGQGTLGRSNNPALFRMHIAEAYSQGLKVWFADEHIRLVEIEFPALPYPLHELLQQIGEPETKLDYHLDIMPVPSGAWIYPARGLALYLDAGHANVMRLGLFPPCSIDEYLENVHPDAPIRELPIYE